MIPSKANGLYGADFGGALQEKQRSREFLGTDKYQVLMDAFSDHLKPVFVVADSDATSVCEPANWSARSAVASVDGASSTRFDTNRRR